MDEALQSPFITRGDNPISVFSDLFKTSRNGKLEITTHPTLMRLEILQKPPLEVTPQEYEAGKEWVLNLYTTYETKELDSLKDFVEETATFSMSDLPVLSNLSQKVSWFRWLFFCTTRFEHIVHSINVFSNQIIIDYDVVYSFHTGETEVVPFITTVDKSTKSPKAKGFIVSGDLSRVLAKCIEQGGPPPVA